MTMQIRATGVFPPDFTSSPAHERRAPVRELAQALRAGDLAAASDAYAALAAKAPHRAERHPDGQFAQIGTALAKGDLDGARAAFASIFTSHLPRHAGDAPPAPIPEQTPTTPTRSGPGGLLDVSA